MVGRTPSPAIECRNFALGVMVLIIAVAAACADASGAAGRADLGAERSAQRGKVLFADNFRGRRGRVPNRRKWVRMHWCDKWGSLSCNTARRRNVALTGRGKLRITAIRQPWRDAYGNTGSWTAARLETQHKFKFRFGTLKARIKVPAGKGLWPSFWTTSATKAGWPRTGEIDVMELLGHAPRTYYCSVHGADRSGRHIPRTRGYRHRRSLARRFHVYSARWRPGRVSFFVDGRRCGRIETRSIERLSPQQIMVGMAVGGSWPGNPNSRTPRRASMFVDWVRVYAP
jgi:beta-glucanase (GH16 family)